MNHVGATRLYFAGDFHYAPSANILLPSWGLWSAETGTQEVFCLKKTVGQYLANGGQRAGGGNTARVLAVPIFDKTRVLMRRLKPDYQFTFKRA